jgi:hypothetical protein
MVQEMYEETKGVTKATHKNMFVSRTRPSISPVGR